MDKSVIMHSNQQVKDFLGPAIGDIARRINRGVSPCDRDILMAQVVALLYSEVYSAPDYAVGIDSYTNKDMRGNSRTTIDVQLQCDQ